MVAIAAGIIGGWPAIAQAQARVYSPIALQSGKAITDTLSNKDIPTGQGGFARDYVIPLQAGDQVAVELRSDQFDTIVLLMAANGAVVGENDDGPDGTTNSLLFVRIVRSGSYIIRVSGFGETAEGNFGLRVTRLRPESP